MKASEARELAKQARQPKIDIELKLILQNIDKQVKFGSLSLSVWLDYGENVDSLKKLGYRVEVNQPLSFQHNYIIYW